MTGSTQVLMAGGTGLLNPPPAIVLSQVSAGVAASPNVIFLSDGTITVAGNGSSCVPPNWYTPTTAAVGASFWCKLTINSGTAPDSGLNTVLALSTGRTYQWTQSVVGTKSCNATVTFYADAGATQAVGAITFNVTAQRTS